MKPARPQLGENLSHEDKLRESVNLGIWESGNLGIWESGNLGSKKLAHVTVWEVGLWESGNLGVLESGKQKAGTCDDTEMVPK